MPVPQVQERSLTDNVTLQERICERLVRQTVVLGGACVVGEKTAIFRSTQDQSGLAGYSRSWSPELKWRTCGRGRR